LASRRSVRRATARTPGSKPERERPSGRRTFIVITLVFLAVIAISIVIGFYFFVWKDLWRPVLRVNDETINMDYFLRRLKDYDNTYGTYDIETMLLNITIEEIIRQRAPDYGIEVTSDEIDEWLWNEALGENETISESEFQAWYRNALNVTQFSDAEYRALVEIAIMQERLDEYLRAVVPTEAEQVHLYIIIVSSGADAAAAIARIEDGEDFSDLARELSIEEESAEQGGDIGWWPYLGGLNDNLESWAFSLEVGEVSGLMTLDEEGTVWAICMVMEKQSNRVIEEDKLETIRDKIFDEWLYYELDTVDSERFIDNDETRAWIHLQMAKD